MWYGGRVGPRGRKLRDARSRAGTGKHSGAFSTSATLPFWTFVSSNVISLFIPSGGGHWLVRGPVMVPAAERLGVDQGLIAMCVAWGEGTANMIQPFWAFPILGIVGLGIRDIMGYGVLTLALSFNVYGAFAPLAALII